MTFTFGIDIGTFESKAALVASDGSIVAQAAVPHRMIVPQPGWAEHEAENTWWGDVTKLSQQVLAESRINPKDIACVGISAIGPCMLPVDKAGTPLMNGVLYGVDTRAAHEIETLTRDIGAERLLSETGNALTSQSVGPKILWLKNNRRDLYDRAHKFVNATTFVNFRLTGKWVTDHYSAANWGPLYLPQEEAWSMRLSDSICSLEQLTDLAWTTDVIGEVTGEAAAATGLAAGTPVIAGTIDAASEAVSVGVLEPGTMMLMYGSTIFIILVTEHRVQDARLWYAPWLFKGQHASMSGLATSGTLTHWFREQFARELADPKQAAIQLAREAATSPKGAKDLLLLPYFSGERTPLHDPLAKGVVFGLDLTHTRADIYRALLEGIAHSTRHVLETYQEAGVAVSRIEAVGGGTNNKVWTEATSDICGVVQSVRNKTIGASYGDAFLAALAIGTAKPCDILQWNGADRCITPDIATAQRYDAAHQRFRKLYVNTRELMHAADEW